MGILAPQPKYELSHKGLKLYSTPWIMAVHTMIGYGPLTLDFWNGMRSCTEKKAGVRKGRTLNNS